MRKKIKVMGLISAFIISALTLVPSAYAYSGGAGTSDDPYQITTQADLEELSRNVNAGTDYSGQHFKLTADIQAEYADTATWEPIGYYNNISPDQSRAFNGTFDGNGYDIRGLEVKNANDSGKSYGLFGYIGSAGVVKDIALGGIQISGSVGRMGGIAGVNAGKIESVIMEGTLGILGSNYLGGAVGINLSSGTIANVYINAAPGGLDSTFSITSNETPASATDMFYIGGIAGSNDGTIYDSAVGRMLSVGGPSGIGGIAGHSTGTIAGTYVEGNITTNKWIDTETPTLIGAIAGDNEGNILNSIYLGDSAKAAIGTHEEEQEIPGETEDDPPTTETVVVTDYQNINKATGEGTEPASSEVTMIGADSPSAGEYAVGFIYTQPRIVSGTDGDVTEEAKTGSRPFPYNGAASQYTYSSDNSAIATVQPCPESETEDSVSGGTTIIPGFYAPEITFTGAGETTIKWTFTTKKLIEASQDTLRSYSFDITATSEQKYVESISWGEGCWDGTSMLKGDTKQLVAEVYPADVTDTSLTWQSSNDSVATVAANGQVTARGNGTVTITAIANGSLNEGQIYTTKTFEVRTAITSLSADNPYRSVEDNDIVSFTVTAAPADVSDRQVDWYIDYTGTGSNYELSQPSSTMNGEGVATTNKTIVFNNTDTVLVKAVSGGDVIDGIERNTAEAVFTLNKRDSGTVPEPDPETGVIDSETGSGVIPVDEESGEQSYISDFLQGIGAAGGAGTVYVPEGINGAISVPAQPEGSTVIKSNDITLETARTLVSNYWGLLQADVAKATIIPNTETAVTTYTYTTDKSTDPSATTENTYLPLDLKIRIPKSAIPSRLYADAQQGNFVEFDNTIQQVLSYVHLFAFVNTGDETRAVSLSDVCGNTDESVYRSKYISVTQDEEYCIFGVRLLVFDQPGGRDDTENNDGKNLWVSTIEDPSQAPTENQLYLVLQDGVKDDSYKVSLGAACMTTNTGSVDIKVTGDKAADEVEYTIFYGQALGESQILTGNQQINDVEPGDIQVSIPTFEGLSGTVWKVVGEEKTVLNGPMSSGDHQLYTTTLAAGESLNLEIEYGNKKIESISFSDMELAITADGGESKQLELNILPSDAVSRELEYSILDPEIASVDETGLVTAISTKGNASASVELTVTAKDGGATYTGTVTVVQKPYSIAINGPEQVMQYDEAQYTATFNPDYLNGSAVTWSVITDGTTTGQASVDSATGVVYATAAGSVKLRATLTDDPNYYVDKTIQVIVPLESMEVTPSVISIKAGEIAELSVIFAPENVSDTSLKLDYYSDSGPGIAEMTYYDEETGEIEITGYAPGTAKFTFETNALNEEGIPCISEVTVRVFGESASESDMTIMDEFINMSDPDGTGNVTLPDGININDSGFLSPSKSSPNTSAGSLTPEMASGIKSETAVLLGVPDADSSKVVMFEKTDSGTPSNMTLITSPCENPEGYWLTEAVVSFTAEEVSSALGDISVSSEDFIVTLMFEESDGIWEPVYLNGIVDPDYFTVNVTDGGVEVRVPVMVFDKAATITDEQSEFGYPYLMPFAAPSGSEEPTIENYLIMDGTADGEYKFGIVVTAADTTEVPEDPDNPDPGEDEPGTDEPTPPAPAPDDGGSSGGCNAGIGILALLAGIPLAIRAKRNKNG